MWKGGAKRVRIRRCRDAGHVRGAGAAAGGNRMFREVFRQRRGAVPGARQAPGTAPRAAGGCVSR